MQTTFSPRYEVEEQGEGIYAFRTEAGSIYSLQFIEYAFFDGLPVYIFNIDRNQRTSHPADSTKIENTVGYVLHQFFQRIDDAIFATCDVDDGMQRSRKRLFDRWLRHMNDGSILTLTTRQDTGDGIMTDATLYYHRDNMFRLELERLFRDMVDEAEQP